MMVADAQRCQWAKFVRDGPHRRAMARYDRRGCLLTKKTNRTCNYSVVATIFPQVHFDDTPFIYWHVGKLHLCIRGYN